MTASPPHLQDEHLLLYASGELRARLREQVAAHLESCAACQNRLIEFERMEAQLCATHRDAIGALPSAKGPRALLKANLSSIRDAAVAEDREEVPSSALRLLAGRRGLAAMGVAALVVFTILVSGSWRRDAAPLSIDGAQLSAEPNASLTPGAAISLSRHQVCAEAPETTGEIPQALKVQVLRSYGVPTELPETYEVDYLITPGLGGATDIRNLWPEPYDHTVWNAHVKDQLEERLRSLVCQGSLDLATAQHDISTDWIAAYRKYFHTEAPTVGSFPELPSSRFAHLLNSDSAIRDSRQS